jgi:hypothetical protein
VENKRGSGGITEDERKLDEVTNVRVSNEEAFR